MKRQPSSNMERACVRMAVKRVQLYVTKSTVVRSLIGVLGLYMYQVEALSRCLNASKTS